MEIIEFLKVFYTLFFVWLTCLTAIFTFRRTLPLDFQLFTFLVILLSILETIGNAIGFFSKDHNNHFFFNILYAIELTCLPYFFSSWLNQRTLKNIVRVYSFIFPLFVLVNTIWIQDFFAFQTYSFVVGGGFVLILAVIYLWKLYTNEETQNIFRDPVFWVSLAYFLYFAVTVPFFGMLNYLVTNHLKFSGLYYAVIIDGAFCLYNILLTIGFLCMRHTMK